LINRILSDFYGFGNIETAQTKRPAPFAESRGRSVRDVTSLWHRPLKTTIWSFSTASHKAAVCGDSGIL